MTDMEQQPAMESEDLIAEPTIEESSEAQPIENTLPQDDNISQPEEISKDIGLKFSSEEFQNNKTLQNFKSADDLAKSYLNLNQLLGKRMQDMTPEDAQEFYGKIGVPASSESYEFPDGLDTTRLDWFKGVAHEAKLSKDQARALAEKVYEMESQQLSQFKEQQAQLNKQYKEAVQKEFGTAFKERVQVANEAIRAYGGSDLFEVLKQHGLGSHPTVVKAFANIGKDLVEDRFISGEKTKMFGITPGEAEGLIAQTRSRYKDALANRSHPEHQVATAELAKLYAMKNGRK